MSTPTQSQEFLETRLAWYFDRAGRETPQSPLYMPFDDAGFEWKDGKVRFAYAPESLSETRRREKALVKTLAAAHELYVGHSNVYYVIGVITSGLRGYAFADKNRRKMLGLRDDGKISTKNLSKNLGGDAFNAEVIYPSMVQNIIRTRVMEQNPKNKDIAFYCPSMGESTTFADNGFLKMNPDEVTYMIKHYPEIDTAKGIVHPGDWFSSRNGALETWRGTIIQAGLHPFRPIGDIELTDEFMNPISLYDRTKPIFDVLKMIVPQGFVADTHATVLLRSLYLDDVLKGNEKPEFTFNSENVHPILKFRSPDEEEKMEQLRSEALLFLHHYCRDFINTTDIPNGYLECMVKKYHPQITVDIVPPMPQPLEIRPEDYDFPPETVRKILGNDFNEAKYISRKDNLLRNDRTQSIDRQSRIPYANPVWKSIGNNAVRRTVMRLTLNALGITLSPNSEPCPTLILEDAKINARTIAWADKNGVKDYRKLLENEQSDEALKRAVSVANGHTDGMKKSVIAEHPSRFVITQNDITSIEEVLYDDEFAFSDMQPINFGSQGRTIMRDEIMASFTDEVIFGEKWFESPDLTYHMGRAFLIQNGLIDRPPEIEDNRIKINVMRSGNKPFATEPIALDEAIEKIADVLIRNHENGIISSPYHAMTFLQLNDISDYHGDFYLNRMKNDIAHNARAMTGQVAQSSQLLPEKKEKVMQVIGETANLIFPDISWMDGLPEHMRRTLYTSSGKQKLRTNPNIPDAFVGTVPRM